MNGNRRRALALASGILVAIIIALLIPFVAKTMKSAGADPNPPVKCGDPLHFYSQDAPGNQFGPPVSGTEVNQLKDELHARRIHDPALVVAHAKVEGIPGFVELNGDVALAQKTVELRDNPVLWCGVIRIMEAQESSATASIETMKGSYQTLYMVDTSLSVVPLIRKDVVDRPTFRVLRFTFSDGSQVNLKLDCGFQPVAQSFPGIPPVKTPECPPHTVPFEGRCVKEASDDGTGGNQSRQSQPVAEHPQGPTPGAPSTPPPAERPLGDPNGGSGNGGAPAPTAPDDNTDSGQSTTVDNTQVCPLGPGNC